MRKFIAVALVPFLCLGQSYNYSGHSMAALPSSGGSAAVGYYDFWNKANTFRLRFSAPDTFSANAAYRWPSVDGSAGQCLTTDGSGNWSFSSCSGGSGTVTSIATTSPITGGTITSTGTIGCATCVTSAASLTSNSVVIGGGSRATATIGSDTTTSHALFATAGAPAFRALLTSDVPTGTSGATIPLLSTANTWTNTQSFTDKAQSVGTCVYPGAITLPCWYNDNKGIDTAQNVTSRYTFNSMADQARTGSYTFSGSTLTIASGVDLSWVGGQILLCPTTCTASNGTLYPITAYLTSTTLTITGSPGASGSFSYAANAFQTSQGTMYITGTGFGYLQNAVVTNGFTALSPSLLSGVVAVSGSAASWVSGSLFNPSMVGGLIKINTTFYTVTSVLSSTQLTFSGSLGASTQSFQYTGDAFRLASSGSPLAHIDALGDAVFTQANYGNALIDGNGIVRVNLLGDAAWHSMTLTTPLSHSYIASTAVTPGSYTAANITVQADGTITAASNGSGGSGTVTSIATTSPITGGTITSTGTIGCATCVHGPGPVGMDSNQSSFSTGTKTITTGLSTVSQCVATPISGGTPAEYIGTGSYSGSNVTFYSSNPASSGFFAWVCTGTP